MGTKILNIVAYAYVGKGISGGDRIFIECVKRWSGKDYTINVFTSKDGLNICKRYGLGLKNVTYIVLSPSKLDKFSLYLVYIIRLIKGSIIITRFVEKIKDAHVKIVVYSESDFWPDSIPAWILKMKFRKAKWVAGFYLFVSNPFSNESTYKGKRFLRGLFYYLSQIPVYWLVKKYADMVWVTNELDRWRFIDGEKLTPERVIAVRGGVDTKTPSQVLEPKEKKYDAVFIGRFCPEKGILELIDIWKYVCEMKRDAKLAVLGAGELEKKVEAKIIKYHLGNNIELLGFKDGVEKFKIIKESKVILHSSIYDSGGMAACEAMLCGLPGVCFDLLSLRVYYPKGMLKAPRGDLMAFAKNIINLLDDRELYNRMGKEALEFAKDWDWDKRAKELLNIIQRELFHTII